MAASSITVSSPVCVLAGTSVASIRSSQTPQRFLVSSSVSSSSSSACRIESKISSSCASFFNLGSRGSRNSGIVARAVEVDDTQDGVLAPAEDSFENVLAGVASTPAPAPSTKVYIGNLPWSVDSKQLAEVCQECGNVELVEVIYDRDTQRSRGFAFVTMRTVEDAEKAIEMLDGYELEGRVLKVNLPQSGRSEGPRPLRNDRPPRREASGTLNKIFVGNLSWGVDDVALAELFSEYGQVVEAKVVHDRETGRSRGFAFLTMASVTEVDMAIQALDGAEFDGRILRVNHAGDRPERRDSPRREY